jgi:hypothetical protein
VREDFRRRKSAEIRAVNLPGPVFLFLPLSKVLHFWPNIILPTDIWLTQYNEIFVNQTSVVMKSIIASAKWLSVKLFFDPKTWCLIKGLVDNESDHSDKSRGTPPKVSVASMTIARRRNGAFKTKQGVNIIKLFLLVTYK